MHSLPPCHPRTRTVLAPAALGPQDLFVSPARLITRKPGGWYAAPAAAPA